MTDIALSLIRNNPYRDFDLHPIDETQVEKLRASIVTNGRLWSGVVARPHGEHYQLAFGHHRIEAARREQMAAVSIEVVELSDAQMARMLASENATQRGTTAAASLDAVAAMSRMITETCVASETPEEVGRILPTLSPKAAESVWGKVRRGGEPGRDCIQSELRGIYSQTQIELALHVLRDSGRLGDKPKTFDARCAKVFRLDYHLETFRRFTSGETVQSYLPVDGQLEFATYIMAHLREQHPDKEITADMIRIRCWERMESQLGIPKARFRNAPDRPTLDQIKEGLNRLRRALADFRKGKDMLLQADDQGEQLDEAQAAQLDGALREFAAGLLALKARRKPKLRVIQGRVK